jgi:hypothetical protein
MPIYNAKFVRVITNGPFAYVIFKDGIGQKSADNVTAGNLLSSISADISALLGGETVDGGNLTVRSTT